MSKIPVENIVNSLLDELNPKQRKVAVERFGLESGERNTLQSIGDKLGITRERVRQIENHIAAKLKPLALEKSALVFDFSKEHLVASGGFREDQAFINDLINHFKADIPNAYNKIKFLFLIGEYPHYHEEDDQFRGFWYADQAAQTKFLKLIDKLSGLFEKYDKDRFLSEKIHLNHLNDFNALHAFSIFKNVGFNTFGDFGLLEWPEIDPRTIRDKIYLILKKKEQALHFTDIAKSIDSLNLNSAKKGTHPQTVHNELIKDDRFVLVGRGLYGLREHGYEPGTVKEIITKVLKANGPLTGEEIVNLVNEKKFFKKQTILANLQNRQNFKRLPDNRYQLKK